MGRLLTSQQMQTADRGTIEQVGLPGLVLMENAGAAATEVLLDRAATVIAQQRPILILVGPGNNGGDGFVMARRLLAMGIRVHCLLFAALERLTGDARTHAMVFVRLGGMVQEVGEAHSTAEIADFSTLLAHAGVVVDAIFGTGLVRPIEGVLAQAIAQVNATGKPVLAVDMPSGVQADRGAILGIAIQARWTVTFAAEKIGHRTYPGAERCGEVILRQIGIPAALIDLPEHRVFLNQPPSSILQQRSVAAHKGHFGHLLLLAGSPGKAGAAVLAALGAARTGPGLLTVATAHALVGQIVAHLPEAMTIPLPDPGEDGKNIRQELCSCGFVPTALGIGPGLGTGSHWLTTLLTLLHSFDVPAVLDADALTLLAADGRTQERMSQITMTRTAPVVVTPHPGEMARLTGMRTEQIQADRLGSALRMAAQWQVWVVLKGAGTVIAAPDGRAWLNATGNPGMAAGGSGDVLTGMIAGLLTQGLAMEEALSYGVWMHGKAADQAAQQLGMVGLLASDLLPFIQQLRNCHCS